MDIFAGKRHTIGKALLGFGLGVEVGAIQGVAVARAGGGWVGGGRGRRGCCRRRGGGWGGGVGDGRRRCGRDCGEQGGRGGDTGLGLDEGEIDDGRYGLQEEYNHEGD